MARKPRLPSLLTLLEQYGVTSYDDGVIRLTLGPRRQTQEAPRASAQAGPRRGEPPIQPRKPFDAVDLAIKGIDYDPDESPEPPEGN